MPIEQVSTLNFFGHTKMVANKISKVIGVLFRLKNIINII